MVLRLNTPREAADWLRSRGARRLCTDSRAVRPGDAFIAWPGAAVDARAFAGEALTHGAVACLVEEAGWSAPATASANGPVADALATYTPLKPASGWIAAEFLDHPSRAVRVIAVTGTNGKTSTAWWLAQALGALPAPATMPCGVVGTLGIGVPPALPGAQGRAGPGSMVSSGMTTPDPVLLQQAFADLSQQGVRACAIEASSIGIEEQRLDGTRIDTAVFTNFTQDHLDYHGDMRAYWAAKRKLFAWEGLRHAVINIDDLHGRALALELRHAALDVWTVSALGEARLQARNVAHTSQGLRFDVAEGSASVHLQSQLIGSYNVSNLLGVLAALRAAGVSLPDAVQVAQQLQPVPGRMQCLGGAAAPLVAVDYAHTPDALGQALEALRPLATERGGRLWCVFGCGGDRDASKRPLMGAIAAKGADLVVVTSDNPRSEKPEAIIAQILLGLPPSAPVEVQADRAAAILDTVLQARDTDVILLAGKGHEQTQDIAGVKHAFADADHAVRALLARGAGPAGARL